MNGARQPELISADAVPPVCRTRLEALDSPKHAYYEIAVYHISGVGYHISKMSGAQGARPNVEVWFRPCLSQALDKKRHLVNAKLNRKAKGRRVYIEIEAEGIQL